MAYKKHVKVKDFYCQLPSEIKKEDMKAVAQYVADQFGALQGLRFILQGNYQLSQNTRGRSTCYANAHVWSYGCSQRARIRRTSQSPSQKKRNRQCRIQKMDCSGKIKITIFPEDTEF